MDFSFREEQQATRDLAKQILGDRSHARAAQASSRRAASASTASTWAELAEAGLLGIAVPEDARRRGLGFVELVPGPRAGRPHGRAGPAPRDARAAARCRSPSSAPRSSSAAWLPGVVAGDAILTAALVETGTRPAPPDDDRDAATATAGASTA